MRYIRTSGPSPLSALRSVASALDPCWWYLAGNGFSMTAEFCERVRPRNWDDAHIEQHFGRLLLEYVDHETSVGRVGKPGFFKRLGDCVDFSWTILFAIESRSSEMPLIPLQTVDKLSTIWLDPIHPPPDVMLIARDVDGAYQDYGLRDEWMFKTVLSDLRTRGFPVEEVFAS